MLQKIFFLFLLLFCFTFTASGQTADEVITKHIQARGGLDKIKAVKTIKQTGSFVQQGQEVPIILYNKRPNSVRFELVIQGTKLIQAYDGQTGWAVSPFLGTKDAQKLSEEDLKEVKDQADIDGPLVDYQEKGNKVMLVGKEDLDGSPAFKLKVEEKSGDVSFVYLDAENYLELKSTEKRKLPNGEIEFETYLSDYKAVNGVLFPHSIASKAQGQEAFQAKIKSIEVNVDMDDNLFKMPAAGSK